MLHHPKCIWQTLTPQECEFRATHEYCPHPAHACTCSAAALVPEQILELQRKAQEDSFKQPVNLDPWSEAAIEKIFTYHKPFGDQSSRYETLRAQGKLMALEILRCCPSSRERSLALTKLQEVCMFANAAIAINEKQI